MLKMNVSIIKNRSDQTFQATKIESISKDAKNIEKLIATISRRRRKK